MIAHRAESLKKHGFRAGLGALCLVALLSVAMLAPGTPVDAQNGGERGQVIHGRSKPFRDTVAKMKVREAEIVRKIKAGQLPPRIWPRPDHFRFKKVRPQKEKTVDASTFLAPGGGESRVPGSQAPQVLDTSFAGTSMQDQINELAGSTSIPPDTMGAVGPNHFVIMINGSVAIHSKITGARLSIVSLDTFFTIGATAPPGGSFDPRILYDRPSGRWFACALDFASGVNNDIILAVSANSDPTGAWDKYSFVAGDGDDFADYQSMGVDANGVYFGWAMFLNGINSNGVRIAATPKANLIAASPTLGTVTAFGSFSDMYGSPQASVNLDGTADGRAFFVASSTAFFADINYRSLTWSGSTPILTGLTTLSTPAYGGPANFAPSGSTMPLSVGDDRIMMTMIRNNRLWTARTVRVNSSGGSSGPDRNACEWFELSVLTGTATLVQNGRVFDTTASPNQRHYFYPSIVPSGQGHAAMGFSGAKSSEFIGAYTCGRLSSDAANTMQAVELIKAGEAAYTHDFGSGRNRWGDYSYTTVDPNDDMTLWTIQEYAESAGSSIGGSTSRWGTHVVKLLAPAPTMSNPGASANQGDNDKVINLTGTGFFDPGASFTNRLDVTISGDGISGRVVSFTNSTTASVTFDVAANATAGARNITLTNPDGQSVTVMGALTIVESGMPPPTSLVATAITSTRVDLTWGDNSSDELGFKIERRLGTGAYSQINTTGANAVSFSDTTVSPNSTYTYQVRAFKTGVDSAYSNEDDATTPPLPVAPSNLVATATTSTRINLFWSDNSSDETGFKIDRKTGAGSFAALTSVPANKTFYPDTSGLSPSTTYTYRMRSFNGNGNSAFSNEDDATTPPLPVAPTNLVATAATSTRIDLTWNDNSGNENGFKIDRKTGMGSFSTITTTTANKISYSDTAVAPENTYTYRVRSYNVNGASTHSNEDDATTPALPVAPTNLVATAVTSNRIDLTWSDNSGDENGFKIHRKTGAGSFGPLTSVPANKTSYSDTSPAPNTTYTYRVWSFNANGSSGFSNEDDATTPALPGAPTALNATAVSASQIDLSWTDNATDEQGFKIERKTTGAFAQIVTRAANVTTYSNTGLAANTTYTYRVRAYNANGHSAYSNEEPETTPAALSSSTRRAAGGSAPKRTSRPPAVIRRKP